MDDKRRVEIRHLPSGVPNLDVVLGGGLTELSMHVIAGVPGTGKTILTLSFLVEGVRCGEPGVMVTFEESPEEHIRKARTFGWDLGQMVKDNRVELIYMRPVDLTVEEVLQRIETAVSRIVARRVVLNSISGFELAIAPTEREDFREALYHLTRGLSGRRINLLMTTEVPESFSELQFSFHNISFLTDNIVLLRYVEIASSLALGTVVVKMRTSQHSRELREYAITDKGIEVGVPFKDYSAILSGMPAPTTPLALLGVGLSEEDRRVLQSLLEMGESTSERVAQRTGLDSMVVRGALEGLVAARICGRGRRARTHNLPRRAARDAVQTSAAPQAVAAACP
ncbi:MAG: hypothetical protein HYY30_06255 [Chloroflexi bacterium]|nr:hypothetical protein [Chloroflexota bacterium]